MRVAVEVFGWSRLSDFAELRDLLAARDTAAITRLVVLGKTEGPATLNDYSREVATAAAEAAILAAGGPTLLARSTLVFSTGCEGIAAPFGLALLAEEAEDVPDGPPRLVLGAARTAPLDAADRGSPAHARHVAGAVAAAMRDAGLTAAQVGLVLVKTPVPPATGTDPARAGSTGAARAAGALGAALALGEVTQVALDAAGPLARTPLHGSRTMAFSGTELAHDEVVVLGNRPGAAGALVIGSAAMADALDLRPVRRLAAGMGMAWDGDGMPVAGAPLRALFLKLGVPPGGVLRGRRTTVLGSELTPDKHLRAAASGIAGAVFGDTRVFVSGGAEGQAPPGGGLFAAIAEARP